MFVQRTHLHFRGPDQRDNFRWYNAMAGSMAGMRKLARRMRESLLPRARVCLRPVDPAEEANFCVVQMKVVHSRVCKRLLDELRGV